MSRPREFNMDKVLNQSMEAFWANGYKATSFEDLMNATGLRKQSLYGAFGDKRSLYLKALALYRNQSVSSLREMIDLGESPIRILDAIRSATLCSANEDSHKGCMMVNTALEFGLTDQEISSQDIAVSLANTLRGIRILEKTGAPITQIEIILDTSLEQIKK
jgi:TetR/AcrR family transcriptional repressor of nem operon